MSEKKQHVQYTSKFHLSNDGRVLKIERVKETKTYEIVSYPVYKKFLVDTVAKPVKQYFLTHVTKEQCSNMRINISKGVIVKKNGELYIIELDSVSEIRKLLTCISDRTHLCGCNCSWYHPTNKVCPKILNPKCNHIEEYDFILDGFEAFWPNSADSSGRFYVYGCSNHD